MMCGSMCVSSCDLVVVARNEGLCVLRTWRSIQIALISISDFRRVLGGRSISGTHFYAPPRRNGPFR
jgi:hypothetical protein